MLVKFTGAVIFSGKTIIKGVVESVVALWENWTTDNWEDETTTDWDQLV